jgi:hypothetical protein
MPSEFHRASSGNVKNTMRGLHGRTEIVPLLFSHPARQRKGLTRVITYLTQCPRFFVLLNGDAHNGTDHLNEPFVIHSGEFWRQRSPESRNFLRGQYSPDLIRQHRLIYLD